MYSVLHAQTQELLASLPASLEVLNLRYMDLMFFRVRDSSQGAPLAELAVMRPVTSYQAA